MSQSCVEADEGVAVLERVEAGIGGPVRSYLFPLKAFLLTWLPRQTQFRGAFVPSRKVRGQYGARVNTKSFVLKRGVFEASLTQFLG